ncbi:GNAT family N-acetyltransferase [Aliiglaciecola sp. LCG003]|uniref:GNAT family N-acetyltransferase n=1 Tax=Aliiglaciecola sp. LCG003 TaxID=3053655 RepID=UPI0025733D18|nr:GNAT family N-acetyltransferase [Aliiglaciecola sp. LCG003]WJG10573.1 GNAT family N-acetyltransferase [Aliiglaciecola sp. LCG003]
MNNSDTAPTLEGYGVKLRPVGADDLEQLRQWRNDPQVSQFMLSQKPISAEQQSAWFAHIQRATNQLHFVIEYKGSAIGSANIKTRGGVKSLSGAHSIEPGLYIGEPKYRQNIIAFSPTLLLNDYCFDVLKCQHLRAIVKANNQAALNYNQKLGYRTVQSGDLIEIELNFEDYQRCSVTLKSLLSRNKTRN